MKFSSQIEKWRNLVTFHAKSTGIPIDFLLRWIEVESDGDIQTTTELNERGVFQIHPDEREELLHLSWDDFYRLSSDPNWSVSQGLRLVKIYKGRAENKLSSWNRNWYGSDFWKFVKMHHGAPAVIEWLHAGVVQVTGSAAYSWDQFVKIGLAQLEKTNPSRVRLAKFVVENAEKTGSVVTSKIGPIILILGIVVIGMVI